MNMIQTKGGSQAPPSSYKQTIVGQVYDRKKRKRGPIEGAGKDQVHVHVRAWGCSREARLLDEPSACTGLL